MHKTAKTEQKQQPKMGRVLARVLSEDLSKVQGGNHDGTIHSFTRGIEPGDYDYD
jgi:hypothetical protein